MIMHLSATAQQQLSAQYFLKEYIIYTPLT